MYEFDWGLPFREPYAGWLISGALLTLLLTVVTSVLSMLLGITFAVGRLSRRRGVRWVATAYVEVFRNVPTIFWLLFFYFVVPTLPSEEISLALNRWDHLPLAASICALSLSNGAHLAEIVRSGLSSLPVTQRSAGLSLGLSSLQVWTSVLLPQALRVSLPAIGPRMVHNFHNTTLAMVASAQELTWQTQQIESITFRGFEAVTIATVFFVAGSFVLTLFFRLLENPRRR